MEKTSILLYIRYFHNFSTKYNEFLRLNAVCEQYIVAETAMQEMPQHNEHKLRIVNF